MPPRAAFPGLFLSLLLTGSIAAQDHAPFPSDVRFLSGYAKDIAGEVLSYWNFHPFAKQSLLTRTTTGAMSIAWQTEAVPEGMTGNDVHFLWIGAYSTGTSSADHDFDLIVNERDTLAFRTRAGGHYANWSVRSPRGLTLFYKHVWTDHVNDAHGYFSLSIPRSMVTAGYPVRLSTTGRGTGLRDWYMTFRYAVRESALVRSLPMLVRTSDGMKQPVEITIDSPSDRGTATVSLSGALPSNHALKLGWNSIEVLTAEVDKASDLPVTISINGGPPRRQMASLRPVIPRTIYLLAHSHNDIGYSDVQTKVSEIQLQNIRDALRLAAASKNQPDGARFKWNVEILWPIDSLLLTASGEERTSFLHAVRDGSIGLNALHVNPLTGIARPEALMHLTDVAQQVRRDFGIKVKTAMISDIPGYSWGIVPALTQAGVRYFTSGPNSGDRIGHFGVAWGDKPFYWRSPSGKDSVLFWVAGTGYSLFHATRTFRDNQTFRLKLCDYLGRLDDMPYPYEIVQMRYSIYSDNGMTDSTMSDYVRTWNEHYASPRLRIATSDEMFSEFERRYGASLPSYSGEITPYWEDGAASSAAEIGVGIRASERLVQAEIATSMFMPLKYDHRSFDDAWDAINLWNEHTWGAWNSVSDPDHPDAVAQWKIKSSYALESKRRAEIRLDLFSARPAGADRIEVLNTSTWVRSDIITLSAEDSRAGDRVLDEKGSTVPSQRLTTGELVFRADRVPPLGSRRFRVVAGKSPEATRLKVRLPMFENGFVRLTMNPSTGDISSLVDLRTDREFVRKGAAANSYLYVAGVDPANTSTASSVRVYVKESGPLLVSVVAEGSGQGVARITREVRLIDGLDRVEIINTIDKVAVRKKEAVYFGFEWNVPEPLTRMDVGWGIVRPEEDQLPGSCKDFFSVQRWVDVSDKDGGLLWATSEAPLVSLGGLVDERRHNDGPAGWKSTAASSASVYSFVMNNYWHTNYKADQEGNSQYRYAVRTHGEFDAVGAYRFGVEWNQPLLMRWIRASTPKPSLPFSLASDAVTATAITPARDGKGWIVRLYNPAPQGSTVIFNFADNAPRRIFQSSLQEDQSQQLRPSIALDGFEVLTVRIED